MHGLINVNPLSATSLAPHAFDLDSGKRGVCCFSLSSALTIDLSRLEFTAMLKSITLSIH